MFRVGSLAMCFDSEVAVRADHATEFTRAADDEAVRYAAPRAGAPGGYA